MDQPEKMRIDKWLWSARFFKTRKLAAEAVQGGKVQVDGQRCKPSKEIKPDSQLTIHKNELEWDITVKVLSKQRRPASEASQFYVESESSQVKRQEKVADIRLQRAANPMLPSSRPNKKERRMIHRFKSKSMPD